MKSIFKITSSFGWAFLATSSPSSAHGAATLCFGHGRRSWIGASVAAESVETEFLADVDTFLAVATEDVATRTFAPETALRVDTIAFVAQILVRQTFVNICTARQTTINRSEKTKK